MKGIKSYREEKHSSLVKSVVNSFISDSFEKRINSITKEIDNKEKIEIEEEEKKIVTTEDELEGFRIVRAILSRHEDPKLINYRDYQNHFKIFYSDKISQEILRFEFDNKGKAYPEKSIKIGEEKFKIEHLEEIYELQEKIIQNLTSIKEKDHV